MQTLFSEISLKPTAEMAANAERGLALRKKYGRGGTAVGVARARDIKNRVNLSPKTVKRMHSFFSRHEGNQEGGEDDAGYIAWLLWGGDAGKAWAKRKVDQIDAKSENALEDACWDGYEAVGTKKKDGKTVPNCVPMSRRGVKGNFNRHKVGSYGPFEIWWVGDPGGSRYFEVKKGNLTTPFNDADQAERYIAQHGGIAYIVQKDFKDFWNSGFGDFAKSRRPMDGMTKRDLQVFLKDAIEMYEDEEDPRGVRDAKRVLQFVSRFSRTGAKAKMANCSLTVADIRRAWASHGIEFGPDDTWAISKSIELCNQIHAKSRSLPQTDSREKKKVATILAEVDKWMNGLKNGEEPTYVLGQLRKVEASLVQWSRPGAKAKMARTIQVHPSWDDKSWMVTFTDEKGGNQVWGPFKTRAEAKQAAERKASQYHAVIRSARPNGKTRFSPTAPSVVVARGQLDLIRKEIQKGEAALQSAVKSGDFRHAYSACRSLAADYQNLGGAYLQWEAANRMHARTGAKGEFDRLAEIRARYTALKKMPKSELFALWQRKMQRGRVEVGGKMSEMDKDWMASDIINAEYNRREVEAAFAASRTGAKTRFEKSDDYARILMKPITDANVGKMMKVASEAIKHAKSVGDDDLLELAEEVGHECLAHKSRA